MPGLSVAVDMRKWLSASAIKLVMNRSSSCESETQVRHAIAVNPSASSSSAANNPAFAVTTEQRNCRIRRRSQLSLRKELRPTVFELTFLSGISPVSYTHLRAHETRHDLVCRLLL